MQSSPVSLAILKRLARKIKREQNVPHFEALEIAAKSLGFNKYAHAQRALGQSATINRTRIVVSVKSRTDGARKWDHTQIEVDLTQSPADLSLHRYLMGYLSGCRIIDDHHIALESFDNSILDISVAQNFVRQVARSLQFMDATGLKPSKANKIYPGGGYWNRAPIADHDSGWYDPASKAHFLLTEPYPGRLDPSSQKQQEWEAKHQFSCQFVKWGSIYSNRTESYLLSAKKFSPEIDQILSKLDRYQAPVDFIAS